MHRIVIFVPSVMKNTPYIVFLLVLFSCQDVKKGNQLDKLSQLEQRLNKTEDTFESNRNSSLGSIIDAMLELEVSIRKNYKSDTVNLEIGQQLNEYKGARKLLQGIEKQYGEIPLLIEEERTSLKKLKSDIENTAGEKAKYDEFLTFEQEKVKQLEVLIEKLVSNQLKSLESYQQLHNKMNDFSHSLVSNNE